MKMTNEHIDGRFDELVAWIKEQEEVVVAFSGGVDSTLVAYSAMMALGESAHVIFCQTPLMTFEEVNGAVALATSLRLPLKILELDPLEIDAVRENHEDRCYHCKRYIFENIAKQHPGVTVLDGTNLDDTFTDRPGLGALDELGVKSPLALLRIGKEEVRAIGEHIHLPNWEKPSAPCLATRFRPNTTLSLEMLSRTQKAERVLTDAGYTYVRIRDRYPEGVIEVHPDEVQRLNREIETLRGSLAPYYQTVTVDPEGYRGSTL